jgi:hypothetical protein
MQFPSKLGRIALATLLAGAVVLSARAVEPDKYIPSDAEAVVVINVKQMLESPLINKFGGLEALKKEMQGKAEVKKFIEATGLDPLKDIHKITVGISLAGGGTDVKYLAAVHGNFNVEKIEAAAAEHAKTKPEELKIITKGEHKIYEMKGKDDKDKAGYAAFANKNTLIVSPSADQTEAAITKGGGKVSATLLSSLDRISGNESVYAALVITDFMKAGMAGNPQMKDLAPKLQFVTATFDMTKDVKLNLAIQTTDDAAATKLKMTISQLVPLLGLMAAGQAEKLGPGVTEIVKKIDVKKDDKHAVTISLTVTEEMIKEMEESAKKAGKPDTDKKPDNN